MIFVISTKNLRSDEDRLLDMETELWELNFELGMPMWYWVFEKLKNKKTTQAIVLTNKINSMKKKLSMSNEYE